MILPFLYHSGGEIHEWKGMVETPNSTLWQRKDYTIELQILEKMASGIESRGLWKRGTISVPWDEISLFETFVKKCI